MACSKRAADHNGILKLVAEPGGAVRRVLAATWLDRALEVFSDVDEAIASFS